MNRIDVIPSRALNFSARLGVLNPILCGSQPCSALSNSFGGREHSCGHDARARSALSLAPLSVGKSYLIWPKSTSRGRILVADTVGRLFQNYRVFRQRENRLPLLIGMSSTLSIHKGVSDDSIVPEHKLAKERGGNIAGVLPPPLANR